MRLRRVEFQDWHSRVVCTDPEVLRYLETRIRAQNPDREFNEGLGSLFEVYLAYEGGGAVTFHSYWGEAEKFRLYLELASDGSAGHGVGLPQPRPRGVGELLDFLRLPVEQAGGRVLVVDAEGSRVERDPTLPRRVP